jgi:hypothetical protein
MLVSRLSEMAMASRDKWGKVIREAGIKAN